MTGFLFALIAGAAMSVQGVMNTRLGEKAGVLETNAFVQLTGFALALAIALIFGKGDIRRLPQAPWYTWLGGVLAPVLGAERLPFTWQKLLGVALMVGGVLLMKWKTS